MKDEETIDTETGSMMIILHSGNAKSDAYEALSAIKSGDFETYNSKYEHALEEMKLANKEHAKLLRDLSCSGHMRDVDLLLVHAEGHLSSTDVAVSLIGEFGLIYKKQEAM